MSQIKKKLNFLNSIIHREMAKRIRWRFSAEAVIPSPFLHSSTLFIPMILFIPGEPWNSNEGC